VRRVLTGRPRSLVRLLWAAVAMSLVAAGCGGGDDEGDEATDGSVTGATSDISEQGDPVDGGSITIGLEAETDSWLPGTGTFANSGTAVAYAIFDPLMRRDGNGEMRPYLAESLTPNDDLSEWTLKLRPNVTFHDGTPLDAQALKTIFDDFLKAPGSNLADDLADVTEMAIVDELTVVYRLTGPNSAFPSRLTLAAGWPFSPTAAAAAGENAGAQPVGTGPFVFDSWERDSRLVVKKNPNYWQEGLPHLDEIVFRPIPDEDTRISSLESGDIDGLQTLRQSAVVKVRDLEGVDTYEHLGNSTGANIFNTQKAPTDDVRVRKALALSINQEDLIEVLGGTGIVPESTQMFSESDPYYSEAVAEAWQDDDIEAAQASLQEYIDDPERSDGRAPGEPVSLRYDCPPDPSLNEISQLYQAFWSSIGIEVELRQVEQATHVQEAIAGDYQAKCFRVGLDGDPYAVLDAAFTEDSTTNFTGFHDPSIDQALDELRATDDLAERQQLVEDIMTTVNENYAQTYSGATLSLLGVNDYVKGLDAWTFPDGSPGAGVPGATTMWAFVWTTE
jgi:peptide/nickel transport system substrate-binding protein